MNLRKVLTVRFGFGALLVTALTMSQMPATAQDDLPPPKDEVCDLFECGGGNDSCMTITYLAVVGGDDVLVYYYCHEDASGDTSGHHAGHRH